MFFAAAATALLVLGGAANAQSVTSERVAVLASKAAAPTKTDPSPEIRNAIQMENPTGLPAYELRPDGVMINGLLPAHRWQG